jgi:opacity protein-like surface antigen
MKKALVVLLILAVAGGLFAQELTWSGAVKTGLEFSYADDKIDGNEDAKIRLNSDDVGDEPLRFDLNGAYTKDNYGVVFGIRTQATAKFVPAVYQAYAWATFLNDVLKVSAGVIDDGTWKTGGLKNWGVNGNGIRFEVVPLEGLSLGLMLRAPTNKVTDIVAKDFFSETAIGAKYGNDLFSIAGAILLDGEGDDLEAIEDAGFDVAFGPDPVTGVDDYPIAKDDNNKGLTFLAGVTVNPIPGLAISAEGRGRNMGDFDKYGYFWFNEKGTYTLLEDKLVVGLLAQQWIFGKTWSSETKPHLKFTPSVGYDILDNLNIGIEAGIGLWQDVYETELNIKPNITYTIAPDTTIGAFYNIGVLKSKGSDSETTHTVQIDLIWTF